MARLKAVFQELRQNGRDALRGQAELARQVEEILRRLERGEGPRRDMERQVEEILRRLEQGDGLRRDMERRLDAMEAALPPIAGALTEMRGIVEAGRRAAEEAAARLAPPPPPAERRWYGLDELDRKLAAHLDLDRGYFVELGANDGVSQSNTMHFERYRQWTGVLVEPVPHNFLKCVAARPASQVFCCACTAFDYPHRFVEIAFSNLMSAPIGLDSDIADPIAHARQGERFLQPGERVFTFGALARPLNAVLIEAGAPGVIDLLSLDVEGAELEVLKGLDHDRFRFRHICVECRDLERMAASLDGWGYALVERLSHHDYLFRGTRIAA